LYQAPLYLGVAQESTLVTSQGLAPWMVVAPTSLLLWAGPTASASHFPPLVIISIVN